MAIERAQNRCILPSFLVLPKQNFVKERLAICVVGAYILKCLQTTVTGVPMPRDKLGDFGDLCRATLKPTRPVSRRHAVETQLG